MQRKNLIFLEKYPYWYINVVIIYNISKEFENKVNDRGFKSFSLALGNEVLGSYIKMSRELNATYFRLVHFPVKVHRPTHNLILVDLVRLSLPGKSNFKGKDV